MSTAAEALNFGPLVEGAFERLKVPDIVAMKVKVIARVAEEESWVDMFQEVGLTKDVAIMFALIIRN